ncbi:MAG: ATP synthase subunit I [bacterium]
MQTRNKTLVLSGVIAIVLGVVVFFIDNKLGRGIIAGYLTGLLNYFLIAQSVKRILSTGGAASGKVMAAVFFYFARLILAAFIIAAVVMAANYYSVPGFIVGFTLCVVAILLAHKVNG